eukprot:3707671-Rhodomonas_salina.2
MAIGRRLLTMAMARQWRVDAEKKLVNLSVSPPKVLHAPYALSGTEREYAATRSLRTTTVWSEPSSSLRTRSRPYMLSSSRTGVLRGSGLAHISLRARYAMSGSGVVHNSLRARYAMSGTDLASRVVPTPALPWRVAVHLPKGAAL